MPDHIGRQQWGRPQIEAAQREGLRALLAQAIENSPFHSRQLGSIDPSRFELSDLASLPVMTKAEMMQSLDEVFTDRRLNRGLIEQGLAATAAEPIPILGEYTAFALGGVSGQRGVFVYSQEGFVSYFSSLLRFQLAGIKEMGGPPGGGLTIVLLGPASAVHTSASVSAWTAGGLMPLRVSLVPVTLPLPEIVSRLNALQPRFVGGYPSMLARLATEQRAGRLRIAPMSISSAAETLTPETEAAIADAFGAPISETFASTEGLVGARAAGDEVLVFNSDLCIAELVDAENRPVQLGVPSAKVLVTNLYNLSQPLIRCQLMDSFVGHPDAPDHGHLRAKVRRRSDEALHYEGVAIHPLVVRSVMVKTPEILDYQVRQTPRGIVVDALAVVPVDRELLTDRLVKALAAAGLEDPLVTVRIVDHLECHPETGKIRRFVPLPADPSRRP